jgi:hypothetical protein
MAFGFDRIKVLKTQLNRFLGQAVVRVQALILSAMVFSWEQVGLTEDDSTQCMSDFCGY